MSNDMWIKRHKKNPYKYFKGKFDRDMRDRYKQNKHRPSGKRQNVPASVQRKEGAYE